MINEDYYQSIKYYDYGYISEGDTYHYLFVFSGGEFITRLLEKIQAPCSHNRGLVRQRKQFINYYNFKNIVDENSEKVFTNLVYYSYIKNTALVSGIFRSASKEDKELRDQIRLKEIPKVWTQIQKLYNKVLRQYISKRQVEMVMQSLYDRIMNQLESTCKINSDIKNEINDADIEPQMNQTINYTNQQYYEHYRDCYERMQQDYRQWSGHPHPMSFTQYLIQGNVPSISRDDPQHSMEK